ncbi:MAG: insulinase family protein, partial [Pseudomonadota bacterium]
MLRRILCCLTLLPLPALALNDEVTVFTLENGLQGIVIEDTRAPVVTHMVWYKVGSA